MGVLSNKIAREELKPADHIYSWRQAYIYAHHGIYIGDGMVIHFTRGAGQETGTGTPLDHLLASSAPSQNTDNPCPKCGDQSRLDGGVMASCLDCFLFGGELYRFEYGVSRAFFLVKVRGGTCTRAPSDPPEVVLHRASFLLENGFGVYNIFKNNCEDFAIYCKTGLLLVSNSSLGRSGQAASYVATAKTLVSMPFLSLTASFSGWGVAGYGMYSVGRYCVSRLQSDIGVRRDVFKVPVELVGQLGLDEPPKTTGMN
ncbi:hypothetical protein L6164_033128 [Bauhinia variegata]|uniref:Uncharacterized protein n=1 Tax=Bauhinia variegata TaxID=167791 RepID=A0ACB9KQS4_BAUVA|nr:hypothetical protein L6164_033128 [Bauhinia variegata]